MHLHIICMGARSGWSRVGAAPPPPCEKSFSLCEEPFFFLYRDFLHVGGLLWAHHPTPPPLTKISAAPMIISKSRFVLTIGFQVRCLQYVTGQLNYTLIIKSPSLSLHYVFVNIENIPIEIMGLDCVLWWKFHS